MARYYILFNGKELGPLQAQDLVNYGLGRDSMVRAESDRHMRKAELYSELQPYLPPVSAKDNEPVKFSNLIKVNLRYLGLGFLLIMSLMMLYELIFRGGLSGPRFNALSLLYTFTGSGLFFYNLKKGGKEPVLSTARKLLLAGAYVVVAFGLMLLIRGEYGYTGLWILLIGLAVAMTVNILSTEKH